MLPERVEWQHFKTAARIFPVGMYKHSKFFLFLIFFSRYLLLLQNLSLQKAINKSRILHYSSWRPMLAVTPKFYSDILYFPHRSDERLYPCWLRWTAKGEKKNIYIYTPWDIHPIISTLVAEQKEVRTCLLLFFFCFFLQQYRLQWPFKAASG